MCLPHSKHVFPLWMVLRLFLLGFTAMSYVAVLFSGGFPPLGAPSVAPFMEKLYMSEEAHWEVEGLQRYVAALAEHDLGQSTQLYLGAALGVSFTENDTDISSLSLGNLLDISSFWGSAQAHMHHRTPQQPLHWNTLAALGSLDFTIGSDLGVRMSSSHLTANESRAIPPTLHLMSRLSGGMPEKPV